MLIEALILLWFAGFAFMTMMSLSFLLLNMPLTENITQLDVFYVQFDQLVTKGKNFRMVKEELCFELDTRTFCIFAENNRLIKKPGYEILLDQVSECKIEATQSKVSFTGRFRHKPFTMLFTLP